MSRHWYWSAPSRGVVVVVETHRVPRFSDTSVFDHDGSCIRHGQLRHLCLLCPPVGQQTRKPMLSWSSCDFSLSLFPLISSSHLISEANRFSYLKTERKDQDSVRKRKENSDSSKTCSFCSLWRTLSCPFFILSSIPPHFFLLLHLTSFLSLRCNWSSLWFPLTFAIFICLLGFISLASISTSSTLYWTTLPCPDQEIVMENPFLRYSAQFSLDLFLFMTFDTYITHPLLLFLLTFISRSFLYLLRDCSEMSPVQKITSSISFPSFFFPSEQWSIRLSGVPRAHRSNQVNKQTRRFLFF